MPTWGCHSRAWPGPTEQDGQPVGTLHVGLATSEGVTTASLRLPGTRDQMRQFCVISSLDLLRRHLLGTS